MRITSISKRKIVNPESKNYGSSVFVIETDNKVVPTIIRTEGQFKTDLDRSFLNDNDIKDLLNGEVDGEFQMHKAGDKFVDTTTGEERTFAKDGLWVEGFLTLGVSEKADLLNRIAAKQKFDFKKEFFNRLVSNDTLQTQADSAFNPEPAIDAIG